MTVLDAGNLSEMRVWVMPPNKTKNQTDPANPAYSFFWNFGGVTVEHKRLIIKRHASLPGAMGSADFRLLRNTIDDNDPKKSHPFTWDETSQPLVPGSFVFVTAGTYQQVMISAGQVDFTKVQWFGFIDQIDGDQLTGTSELVGTVTALEVGHLLDRMQVRGWAMAGTASNGSANGIAISSPDSANIGGKVDGQVVGNAVQSVANNGKPCFLFQSDPSLCTTATTALWTRWRLFKHVVENCLNTPALLPGVIFKAACFDGSESGDPDPVGATIAGYLNSPTIPEVFKLRNQTYKGLFDLLIPRPFGFGWTIKLVAGDATSSVSWQIAIYTYSEASTYGLPTFSGYAKTIDLGNLPVLNWHRHTSSVDLPDEIIVEGNQIVFGVTGGFADSNIGYGWSDPQEVSYRAGASAATGYSGLTSSEQLDRNRALRIGPALSDVYTRYTLKGANIGNVAVDLTRKTTEPGIGKGATQPMCPEVTWAHQDPLDPNSPYVLTVSTTKSRAPYLPTATLSRTLPWIEGFFSNGTDNRPAFLLPWPTFARPKLFYYDSTRTVGKQWTDILARGGARSCPGVDIDDRGAAIKVVFDAPERMAYGIIQQGVDAIYDTGTAVSALPWVEGVDGFDWRKVAFTFGIPSDQRISATIRRPGIVNDSDVRNSLKITDEKYNLWIMHGGSVLSILADGTPDRVAGTRTDKSVVVRNDFAAITAHANRLAAYAFRRRRGFIYTGMRPDQPWASVGSAISTVTDGAIVTYNTVVERVECTYGEHPRLVIEADLPTTPNMSGHGSPSSGGPVAVGLNGTVSQGVQQASQDIKKLQADGQRTPLVTPYNPGGVPISLPYFTILGGNTLVAPIAAGIIYRSDTVIVSELPAGSGGTGIVLMPAWPIPTGLPNGVGVCRQIGTASYFFVLLDSTNVAGVNYDLRAGRGMFGYATFNMDVVVGPVTYRYPFKALEAIN